MLKHPGAQRMEESVLDQYVWPKAREMIMKMHFTRSPVVSTTKAAIVKISRSLDLVEYLVSWASRQSITVSC